ncbi:hypothetical protein [Microcoleus sp.]|uniref:hypothetical protein n=1 Tax=Microcoleus sp. TaxID=44472 RepID=UPI0035949191
MRRVRIFALGIVSFFAVSMGALLAPGTFVNRALSAALCTVFSFSSTLCTVNLAKSSDLVVAATPPAVERNIGDWLVRDPGEFDDAPSVRPGSNPQAPPFPQDPGPNQPVRPDFDRAIDSASENAAQDSAAELQQISNAIDQYASEASESAACEFLGKNSRDRIPLQRKPNNQSPTEQKICKYDGRYAVFAKHPIPGIPRVNIPYVSDAANIEPGHEQIFFCENGKITRNVGFGPEGRFSYTNRAIAEGIDETISDVHRNPIRAKNQRVDDFTPIDQLYDAELMDRVLDRSNVCTLIDGPGSYGQPLITGLFNNCQGFAERMRNQFDQKLQSICQKPQQTAQQPSITVTITGQNVIAVNEKTTVEVKFVDPACRATSVTLWPPSLALPRLEKPIPAASACGGTVSFTVGRFGDNSYGCGEYKNVFNANVSGTSPRLSAYSPPVTVKHKPGSQDYWKCYAWPLD